MKIIELEERKIILFLYAKNTLDFQDYESLQEEFKKIFLKLKYQYQIDVNGFYHVKAYIDSKYGVVLEIDGEDLEYLDYIDGEIDMRIEVIEKEFLYQLEDKDNFPKKIQEKGNLYKYQNQYYLELIESLNTYEYGELLEHANIIYQNKNPYITSLKNKLQY